ncbi:hypothetical protein LX32DRAFT_702607 [Colletotrichum zoysiae]|uniref:Uncharacterized protein n=1 Tax=Colletotrichum zoysiae TaxID=1216348 RepID=A0AAD9HBM4_9PEZI|nr:hypothetical protein LX32DRAFT_702607 [Colletotrichum zoysiae]
MSPPPPPSKYNVTSYIVIAESSSIEPLVAKHRNDMAEAAAATAKKKVVDRELRARQAYRFVEKLKADDPESAKLAILKTADPDFAYLKHIGWDAANKDETDHAGEYPWPESWNQHKEGQFVVWCKTAFKNWRQEWVDNDKTPGQQHASVPAAEPPQPADDGARHVHETGQQDKAAQDGTALASPRRDITAPAPAATGLASLDSHVAAPGAAGPSFASSGTRVAALGAAGSGFPSFRGHVAATGAASEDLADSISGLAFDDDHTNTNYRPPHSNPLPPLQQRRQSVSRNAVPTEDRGDGGDEMREFSEQELEDGFQFYRNVYRPWKRRGGGRRTAGSHADTTD